MNSLRNSVNDLISGKLDTIDKLTFIINYSLIIQSTGRKMTAIKHETTGAISFPYDMWISYESNSECMRGDAKKTRLFICLLTDSSEWKNTRDFFCM